jgi:hypothetical protein
MTADRSHYRSIPELAPDSCRGCVAIRSPGLCRDLSVLSPGGGCGAAGSIWVKHKDVATNANQTVAIDREYHWRPIDADTPRGVKLQLICKADNVAVYSTLSSTPQRWDHWAPLPTFAKGD